ncbi:unnamed protein product [Didymodactylos carnosus]|uniref:PiggyBac transposable element-derived protein domain-containing protein n=1 Tax=Didymodactylos carnosus TaxID=1234261 RepID=A0A814AZE9_9BILA|nr:unnamed protein product [Didymodactylos carnosus]CAF1265926.1 unnamed protein product [Didymodactylos carnosus]CAF3700207.1 unnamed protein product [Didymodactylos carnosus]CAF4072082.1 unnamed protein product [Didymodactylos carnosus]
MYGLSGMVVLDLMDGVKKGAKLNAKRVLLDSNFVSIDPMVLLLRWDKKNQKKVSVMAPKIIDVYNRHMGGVDKVDMLCALHPIPFRSKKWYIRIAWRLFDLMVINSWLLANHLVQQNVNWECVKKNVKCDCVNLKQK